jgi:hypothetical protein
MAAATMPAAPDRPGDDQQAGQDEDDADAGQTHP